ncbi:unnamed protein product [Oikopleura dioica]|uniref:Uncharacterized protein n=1 Tax=Oikopleura dioica TaxID=34765 RepID=E4YI31_OIKDI|nr:unnamed protein product [Oikopleura dioica]
MTYNLDRNRKSRIPRKRPAQFGITKSKVRIHEEKISEGFAASDSLCCFSDFSRPKFANGLNLTQNGIPVSVERLENDPWTFEEETKPVLKYSSELEGILQENRRQMRDFVSRIPRISPKHEPPNPHCMTLAVWQPPPIIPADIPNAPILQEANSTPLQSPQRPRSPENFEITERGDNLSPERMDID